MRDQPCSVLPDGSSAADETVRVRLVAPLFLLSQTVAAALRSRGMQIEELPRGRGSRRNGHGASEEPGLLLLIDDLTTTGDVRRALDLVAASPGRVLVLTGREPGRYWGALLAAGAASVMSSASSLDEVEAVLDALSRGEECFDAAERRRLLAEWEVFLREQRDAATRFATLSTRERTVLDAMRSGASVPRIAEQLEVAQTTIRSQVKSILRKLGVRSQLAAVALAHHQESPLVTGVLGAEREASTTDAGGAH